MNTLYVLEEKYGVNLFTGRDTILTLSHFDPSFNHLVTTMQVFLPISANIYASSEIWSKPVSHHLTG